MLLQTTEPGTTRVIGLSYYGDGAGDQYGAYLTGVSPTTHYWLPNFKDEQIACVQVKCPGDVIDGSDVIRDVATEVDLNIDHEEDICKFR